MRIAGFSSKIGAVPQRVVKAPLQTRFGGKKRTKQPLLCKGRYGGLLHMAYKKYGFAQYLDALEFFTFKFQLGKGGVFRF